MPRMNLSTSGNVISGLLAFLIYTVIAIATGQGAVPAIAIGVAIGVVTFLISYAVTRSIRARRRPT
jgi:hypothetical protein